MIRQIRDRKTNDIPVVPVGKSNLFLFSKGALKGPSVKGACIRVVSSKKIFPAQRAVTFHYIVISSDSRFLQSYLISLNVRSNTFK